MNQPPRHADPERRNSASAPAATASSTPAVGNLEARPEHFPIIEGPYLRDILDQPAALRNAVDGVAESPLLAAVARKLSAGKFRRVLLTGMGTSLHALYPLHLALSRRGVASFWTETAELLLGFEALHRPDTLLITVSQSGESAEIVSLLRRARSFGHVIGVTNHPCSRLGRRADTVLLLHAGAESTVSCKSYLTTLAVLHWLGVRLGQGDVKEALSELRTAEHGVRSYLARWREHVAEWWRLTEDIQGIFVTGRAESLATTGTAGLILKESTRRSAEGSSCAAFRHGPMELAGPRVLVLVYAGDVRVSGVNRRLVRDINRGGGRAVLAAVAGASAGALKLPRTCPAVRPIVEILPVQMLSLALAARDGREAGRFERASKITTVA
jgi:glutamine---fructose-6-phosphate transaminase (isomerizing)